MHPLETCDTEVVNQTGKRECKNSLATFRFIGSKSLGEKNSDFYLETGKEIEMKTNKLTFGRNRSMCDVPLKLRHVSRVHCKVEYDASGSTWPQFKLTNLSCNGTVVNGVLLKDDNSEVSLYNGDKIEFKSKLREPDVTFIFFDNKRGLHDAQVGSSSMSSDALSPNSKRRRVSKPPIVVDEDEPEHVSSLQQSGSSTESAIVLEEQQLEGRKRSTGLELGLKESLLCTICQELVYHAVSITPCMHSFCRSCLSSWYSRKKSCPDCRGKMEQVNKNHSLDTLVELYLKSAKQSESLSISEKTEREIKETIPLGVNLKPPRFGEEVSSESSDSDSSSDSDEEDQRMTIARNAIPNRLVEDCIQRFIAIASVPESVARHYVGGAHARNLSPLLDRALSYYYDTHEGSTSQ